MICDECNRSTSGRCWQHQQPIRWTDASERIWREQEAPQESRATGCPVCAFVLEGRSSGVS